ncbi:MAG TPA: response regulator transcription factor [Planctomycetota bacterium]|nr:response regulator transcription factor [Planctomycetota bacterium]
MRLLVVEDNPDLSRVLRELLVEEGFAVDLSTDGEDGHWRATTVDYDAVVLDIVLPAMDGLEILRRMRKAGRRAPVLLLTARDSTEDRVLGLDSGADDYLVKPFALDELVARVRALLRRGTTGGDGSLRHGGLVLDPARRTVHLDGEPLRLTAKEFQVLHLFLREPGRVFSRTEIIERLYDDEFEGMSNVVEVFMSRLRRKLSRGDGPPLLRTVRGVGYALGGEAS